jgi:hypothetical protein
VGAVASFLGAAGAVHEFLAARRLRRRYRDLAPIEELAQRTGTPELSFLLAAREKGINPRCIIDGREYFDVNEMGEAAVLLRASESPEPQATLLIPAGNTLVDESALVRPSSGQ